MKRLTWLGALLAVVAALGIAACGSNDDGDNASSGGQATTEGASSKPAVQPPPTTPPTQIPITTPLSKTPPTKSAIFLQCQLPICARFTTGFKAAMQTLGWDSKVQVLDNTKPGESLQQAIQQKPDYIAMTGIPAAAIKPQLEAAARAGIPVMSCGDTSPPAPGGYTLQCGSTHAPNAEKIARWIVNDAKGPATVLTVNIPQFKQISTEVDWYEKNFASMCDGCSVEKLDVTLDDVGAGKVPQQVVAALQRNPKINYVHFTFSDLAQGVPEALKGANLADKAKLVGVANDKNVVQGVKNGTIAAWTMEPVEFGSWIMSDAMARLASGAKITPDYEKTVEVLPSYVLQDTADAEQVLADGGNWTGPAGSADQFKQLWKVG